MMEEPAAPLSTCPHDAGHDDRKSARLAAQQLEVGPGAQVVKSFAFGREILRSSAMRQATDIGADRFDLDNSATTPVIFLDGEAHRRKRSAISKFFSAKAMATKYRAAMVRATDSLLRTLQENGRGQLDVISFELAVTVASEVVGLTNSNMASMARRIASAFASGTARRHSKLDKKIGAVMMALKTLHFLYRDVRPAIRARLKTRQEDVISQLLDKSASEKEILMECMVYASAGMVTTREFIVMAAWHLFERDELRRRFVADNEEGQFAMLEEILRLEPVAGMVQRRAAEAIPETEGRPVRAGMHFAIDVRAANSDVAVFGSCPYALNPDRATSAKSAGAGLSFGDGAHRCPGSQLAMHETRIFLDRLLRVPGIRLERAPDMRWNQSLMSYELRNAIVTCEREK
jgi:cytochrome P450